MKRFRLVFLLFFVAVAAGCQGSREPAPAAPPDGYLLCFWNVENLFDDVVDERESQVDRKYDTWFAHDPEALALKLDHLASAILELNNGRGPDILALAEVESVRAATLLQEALNQRLSDPALAYTHLLMRNLSAGRHIAPAILTRLPVHQDRTRLHGHALRILEGHIDVDGHDLVVIASHWTARITDTDGGHRSKYGDQIYGLFQAMYRTNPAVDFLVCGDFNDPPDAESVTEHLHATGDREAVLYPSDRPFLLDLFAGKDAENGFGTHYFRHHWFMFDQIAISPGLLDGDGWTCLADSVETVNHLVRPGDRLGRPWHFGNAHEKGRRGYSDHFPVTVRLRVQGQRAGSSVE
jgi:endonuclease/exonuclease/phosphatase family metal-dependent hydrolase